MAQIDYKKILGKIFSRKIDVREKLKVDPSRSWLAIWIFFYPGSNRRFFWDRLSEIYGIELYSISRGGHVHTV
jgi:hypothetical protein